MDIHVDLFMNKAVKRKLRSNEGASLSFALLLFLFFVIIGIIILTAGTVASGRLADKAKMDQRYYRVTSAVEFLRDEFEGEQSTIIRTKEGTEYSLKYVFGDNPENNIHDYSSTNSNIDFLTKKAINLLESTSGEAMWESDFYKTDDSVDNYTFKLDNGEKNLLSVDVDVTLKNGVIIMDVASEGYIIEMSIAPDISEVYSKKENVEKKTTTIRWTCSNIQKVMAKPE